MKVSLCHYRGEISDFSPQQNYIFLAANPEASTATDNQSFLHIFDTNRAGVIWSKTSNINKNFSFLTF